MKDEKFRYTEEVTGNIVNIPIELLHHHHDNPRKDLGDLSELSESIKAKGILQNLTVVPFWFKISGHGEDRPEEQAKLGYLVVIGNRRLEAAKAAGLKSLPCIIANMTHAEQVQTMLMENMQRADLTVFEQAQGFQMMLDFGDTVETVATKTGFSQSTVRRRLKLAELDPKKLKAASNRQITLNDFDKLNQIEDISERNKILDDIGTPNYERSIKNALEAQKRKKYEVEWRSVLLEKGLKEIDYIETFYGKYRYCEKSYCSMGTIAAKDYILAGDELYFSFNYNTVYFRREPTKEDNQKSVEHERENAIRRERNEKLDEAVNRAYELRHDFIFSISETEAKNNAHLIIEFDIRKDWEGAGDGGYYMEYVHERFANRSVQGSEGYELIEEEVHNHPFCSLLRHAYTRWTDNDRLGYVNYSANYEENERLDIIYDFLVSMGYVMSDEEIALKDGTSPLYAALSDTSNESDDDYDEELNEEDAEDEEDEADE